MVGLQSCQQAGVNSTGSEYMPDMGHSIAYEANYYSYYYNNTWGSKEAYHEMAQPRVPVSGTVPRRGNGDGYTLPVQGSVPYYYGDTEEERTRAINELIVNPLPITEQGLADGKNLYNVFCATCHGEKGDGNGYLVRDGGAYPAQPANFLLEEHLEASNGRYYHAIMYGKNVMGHYKDKISYEERWNVIHYIRALQAKELKKTYNQLENTLNNVDKPAGLVHEGEVLPDSLVEAALGIEEVEDDTAQGNDEGHNSTDHSGEDGHSHSDDHEGDDHNH